MNFYRVYFWKQDVRGRRLVGKITISDEGCNETFPLAAKAFRSAPRDAMGADKLEFVKVFSRE